MTPDPDLTPGVLYDRHVFDGLGNARLYGTYAVVGLARCSRSHAEHVVTEGVTGPDAGLLVLFRRADFGVFFSPHTAPQESAA